MTKAFRLSRDVALQFNGGGDPRHGYTVTAKAGTRVEPVQGGMGISYAIPPASCDVDAGVAAIFKHDSTYYHVWAPVDAVESFDIA